jgi:hypothetical protein
LGRVAVALGDVAAAVGHAGDRLDAEVVVVVGRAGELDAAFEPRTTPFLTSSCALPAFLMPTLSSDTVPATVWPPRCRRRSAIVR